MKSALGFGSLRMHKGAKLGGAPGSGKDSAPSSPLSPVVQAPTGPRPAVDPPAKRHKIDAASIGVFEEASPEVQQWCAATQRADLHALAHLIEKGMSADCEIDTLHHTALMFAAQEGRDDMIRLLLNNKANLKTVDGKGKNALIWAAIGGKLSTVTLLLDRGANVDVEDQDGLTPLMHASCFGSTPVVDLLLDSGSRYIPTNRSKFSALQLAARNGHLDCVKSLLHHYPQSEHVNWADGRGWTALIEACSNGHLHIVNFLLEKGAKPEHTDETRRTALHVAALRGHVEVCGCLLAVQPALLDATDSFSATALLLALDQQRLPVVELLLTRRPDLMKADKEGYTLAHVAALTGSVSVLRTLAVEDKELLNACDHRGRTPLLLAAQRGQVESIKFLIAEGVNFEHRDNDGLTMLAHATMGNHPSLVRFMLERYPSLVTMTDLQCRAAADMTEQEEVKNAHKVRPFPTEAYVSQCIEKLQGMLKDIKATGAFQGAEFDACDGPFELIKRTLAEARNESHFRDVAKYLGVSVARPMAEFRNVVPVDGKVSTIRAKIEATEAETALEQACENLRDRGRLVVYLTDRLTRNVRVARSMPIKADKDAIAEITKKVEMYRAKIADWEREKEKLANERAELNRALSQAAAAVAPLKGRFNISFDGERPLDSLERYDKVVADRAAKFHREFDAATKRCSDDIEMLLAVQHVISVQITQQGRNFIAKLNRMREDLDAAKAEYATKLAQVSPLVNETQDAARVQLEKLQKHFNDILAEGTMLEIRKGFLADLTKLEAQMAAAERLAKRMAGTATEVQSAAAQEVETAAEMKVVSTVVYFERQLPKPASSYEVTRAAEMSLELKSEQTTPTDLFGDLGSLIAALPRDSSETDLRPLAAASTAEAQPQPEVEAVVVEEASTVVEPQADVVSAPSSADVAEEAAAAVVDEVEMPVEPTSEANGEAAPEATEILATEEQQKQEEAVAEVVAEAAPAEPQAEVQEPEQQAPAVEAVPDVPEPVPESVSVPAATEAPAAEQPQQEAEAVHSEAEATPAPAAVQEQVAQPAAAPASDGVQTESIHKVADLLAKFDPVAGKAATLRSRSISPVGRNLVAAPQMQPNAKSQ